MRKLWLVGGAPVVLSLLWLWWSIDIPPGPGTPGPAGIWQAVPKPPSAGGPDSFRFDGQYVTLQLMTTKAWEWSPNDSHWRLESRWEGDDLYCRGPYGNWWKVATFVNGRFENEAGGVFRKAGWWSLGGYERSLLWNRSPYDYSLTPAERGWGRPRRGWLEWLWGEN
jgi:hypothetical protein